MFISVDGAERERENRSEIPMCLQSGYDTLYTNGSNIDLRFEKSLENIRYCIIHHPDMNFNGARKRTQKLHADRTADQ